MRSLIRRRYATLAALSAGVLITAGCGGSGGADSSADRELYLQPAAAAGPDPFTRPAAAPAAPAPETSRTSRDTASRDSPAGGGPAGAVPGERRAGAVPRTPRALPGSTPGLYEGTATAGCAVARQVRLLTQDPATSRAFAQGAGIGRESVPGFLRALTPVTLRADVRVTDHGHRAGAVTSFQAVLQKGTAVLVDGRGLPRVRCASGNPLSPPVAVKGSVEYRGDRWPDYRAERVVVVRPSEEALAGLVIADTAGGGWLERRIGTDGGEDIVPAVPPAYGPEADVTDADAVPPPDALVPAAPSAAPSAASSRGANPPDRGADPGAVPVPDADPVGGDAGAGDDAGDGELFGPLPEGEQPGADGGADGGVLTGPDPFQG
ncbi:DUF6777 domain-containing protein [Streptomyces sp. NPDC093109]|uniref:DUF6777 domain-containing protein n=1 Tax=Streptomyces sp. NPDC093109 TaxID=3154977 RepID=UPI00344E12BD